MTSASRCLIDTNVVIYARERATADKPELARRLMRGCQRAGVGALSTQVLIEVFAVLTRRSPTAEGRALAAEHVGRLSVAFPVLSAHAPTVLFAADCSRRHGLSIFDAMMWSTAMVEGIPVVLTEDIGHRRTIGAVTFINPFAEDFDVAEIGISER
jgi:predicted nucleic acid-binding protein